MEGRWNLHEDRLNRLEKAMDQYSGQIEKTKNTLNEIKKKS